MPTLNLEQNVLWVRGDVNYNNVLSVVQQGETFFEKISDIQVNLRDLEAHDSAWLTMLLSWYRLAQKAKKNFHCKIESDALLQTANVYDLRSLLPIN